MLNSWDAFDYRKGSNNRRPGGTAVISDHAANFVSTCTDKYPEDQLYVVISMEYAGFPLKDYRVSWHYNVRAQLIH